MALRTVLEKVRKFLAAIAPITPLKLDDTLVLVIDAALADAELFGWIEAKVAAADNGALQIETNLPSTMQFTLAKRGLTLGNLAAALPVIIELVRLFRG